MSMYGSQQGLNMGRRVSSKGDLAGGGSYHYARSEVVHGGGNGYDPYMDGYKTYTFSKSTGMGPGMGSGTMSGVMSQMATGMEGGTMTRMSGSAFGAINQRAEALQSQCNEYLKKADYAMQSGSGDTEYYMGMAKDAIEKLKYCAMDLRQMGQPNDNVIRSLEICKDRLKGAHMAMTSSMQRRRSTRGSSGGWEDPGRSFHDAMAWIGQHKRLIETAPWGDDPAAIEQQLISHQKFHASIQRSPEMDRARDELAKKGDKGSLHALEQEWDSLQQMSFSRTQQLRDLLHLIQEISKEIMWVNDREEEELMFDWGDKNIDQYIPKKQESYSKLMSALEDKEMELNKLKSKVDNVLKNNHPAADKIEAYKDTLQTQWSWLLQITKCIDVHLKENGAYSQFFREANDTYSALQKEHETVRKKFPCDKSTSLENLLDLLRGLERERDKIMENKRQVQHLVNRSKSIVRLKPRNPEEKSNHSIIIKALCDFKQDQKVICKDNEAILKDNSQRSKWQVTGPGGLDMLVPSVCLIVPPPNPLSISLANKNEQYYEAILSIWNQLYINVKSLIAWQYCLLDIRRINSLTINMLAKMRPEEYRQIIKSLETHYEEFKLSSHGSQMFADEDKRSIENQFTGAQAHYEQMVVQLPTYVAQQEQIEIHQVVEQPRHQYIIIQQQQLQQDAAEEEARRLEEERQRLEIKKIAERKAAAELEARRIEEERRRVEVKKIEKKAEVKKEAVNKEHVVKKEVVKVVRTEPVRRKVSSSSVSMASSSVSMASSSSSRSLSELHSLRLRLEAAESTLSQHLHVCVGEDAVHDCGLKIVQLETVQRDVDAMRDEYLSLRERILRELEGMNDSDKAQFLRSEVGVINQRLGSLESSSSAYVQRLRALRDMLESVARAEDIVKVHEARLTEKETTSLSPEEVDEYMMILKSVKAELDQKKDVLASMEKELAKASHWNCQVGDQFHRCDMMLSKYSEQVGVLSDRWRRIQGQIDTRLQDLQLYVPQLQHYRQTSTSLFDWMDATTKKQNALQATKIESVQELKDHMTNQKALNAEIKAKRETVERVLKDNEACVNAIKDYETDLSSYSSGLETLLNVPIKRTMLKSPSMDLNQEAIQLQTRYMELLTMSGDYHKFLGQSLKNMEELKIRNTRIDLLEEELRLLREDIQDYNGRNKSLEDTVARYQLELSQSQEQLLSVEEVKRNTALQCNATKESLDSTQGQLTELSDQVTRLKYLLEEEKRKRKLAEERYNQQQEEYESVLRKRQNELETVSWSKMDVEKSVANKDHEIESLRRQLDAETARVKELQTDLSKVRSQCNMEIDNLKLSYESQIHASHTDIQKLAAQRDEDTAELQMQYDRMEAERWSLEEEVRRLRMSINHAEEQRMRSEEEAQSQRAVIIEEGRRRRELESQVELLMSQRDEESCEYREELAELMKTLEDKSDQLAYVTHSLDEENRRRKTIEEGQAVLEQTVTQLQVKLTSSSVATTQLREYDEELQNTRLELERESKERSRMEQNMSRLNSRIKDLQAVRDGLESQMENLKIANQEEVARRRQVEAELERTTINMTEYATTITALRTSQEQASTAGKRSEEEHLRLQEELERSLRQNKASAERMTQLSAELKAQQQQLLQEQAQLKEAQHRNDSLCRTIEEKRNTLNENTVQLESRFNSRIKDLQTVRDGLESQVENLRRANQEEVARRRQVEAELEKTTINMTEYATTITALRTSQEQASTAGKRSEEERLRLQEELERSLRQNKASAERMTQLNTELKAQQQQLLQEQAQLKEAQHRNDSLCRTIEEKSKALNENTVQLESRFNSRIKDLQTVRDGLESQMKNLKIANQEEVARRRQVEAELERTTINMTEYATTITALRTSQEQASTAGKRSEEEHLRLQEELERSLRQNKASAERMTQLNTELKAQQQQLLQEQAQLKEAQYRNDSLCRTIEEKSKALNENTVQLESRFNSRIKDLQTVRDGLESQVVNLRRANQEEVARRRQVEAELERTTINMTEYATTITALRMSQEQANTAGKRSEEERLRLQEELQRSLRQNKASAERMTQLSTMLKAQQQQLLQEQAQLKEAQHRNDSLCRTIEEKSKALNENTVQLESRFNSRIKDLQTVRDGLESQMENLRMANQGEVARRRQVEAELEKTTINMTEYATTITALRTSQEQASTAGKRSEEERLRLQEELERSLRQNKASAERMTQLSTELKAQQQQLLQEQARLKEAQHRNDSLFRTIEEKSKALNENIVQLESLKEITETQTKERLRLEEELRAAHHDKEELLRSKQGRDDELSSQITALELQLQASKRSNKDYHILVSELSSEREKLKLETENIQTQATETRATMQSLQSQYNDVVKERDAELRNKQRLQEENERMKRDVTYWKDQCDSKQGMIRQYDTDKEILEREKKSLKSEIERLMRELKDLDATNKSRLSAMKEVSVRQTKETELKTARAPPTLETSTAIFDGVRKPVTANQLLDCGVLDKPTFNQLMKGHKTVPEVSVDKKVNLKGTGPIAGVVIESPKSPGSMMRPLCKMTFTEAKKDNLLPQDSVDLLLDAQAATGHIIDPRTNQKLTVEEACNQGVVDDEDRERLLAAEAAAVGFGGPGTSKPLSVFQAMKKGLIDKTTTLRLLQAQEATGGILDPINSVFLPKDKAIELDLVDDTICRALSKRPELYLDPENEEGVTYSAMKRRCRVDPDTGLLLLPIPEKVDPSKLVFDGVRKPVTAKQLLDCGVLDKPTFKDLEKGKETVPEVSEDKKVSLKGTGPIAGVVAGSKGKMSFTQAKKQMLLSDDSADLLLEAQAATGHIIDPKTNQKLTVEQACAKGVVDMRDEDKLLAAEAAAIGYKDPNVAKPLSVFEAMKKGLIEKETAVRLLQAQVSTGGILDPILSVFLPKETAIKRNIFDENLHNALSQAPECYIDPETEHEASYEALKKRCKIEPHTGLLLLPITEKRDPSKMIFDGVRKPVTAQQLLDCGVLDKPTVTQLMKGEKTVPEVSEDKKIFLKGTGSIAGVTTGPSGKVSFTEAKKKMLIPSDSADLLLDAQAATGHIIDPTSNQKLTVEEACARGVVDKKDRDKLLAAECAAVGYRDPNTAKPLSVFEAMKKGMIDRKTAVRLLQAQELAGGILDPNLSVFLPKDTAIKRNLVDEDICHELSKAPQCYLDPDTEEDASYGTLKKRCKTESHTGLMLLPITERKDPSKLMFDGVRKPVSAQQLFECGVLDKPTFNQLTKGEKTVPEVSEDKKVNLKGTGPIAGVVAGRQGKMSLSEAKKQMLLPEDGADLLLEAQAATGHIIDPKTDEKLTVKEACAKGVVDIGDQDKLLAAEAAAIGYKDPRAAKPLSVFEAMKKGLVDKETAVRLLQAQDSTGGILDPILSVFLPKDTAIKRNLLDENLSRALNQSPECYLDPETEHNASYEALKKKCKTEPHTGLLLLPITEKLDPSKLMFDGVRKPVTAQQLLDCGVLDKPTVSQLMKGEKTVPEVSEDKKVFLKGTGSIAGVVAGPSGKMSFSEAKKKMLMPSDSADLLLEAQAATGHIIDPTSNQKLTVDEACARGVVDSKDQDKLLAAECAAVGYQDPNTAKPLSVFEAMKKGMIDRKTAVRLLQAQELAGGILDPNLSVFLPKDTAIKRNLVDEDICHELNKAPQCYLDPDTERDASYGALKKRCKTESHTGLMLLPITERKDPSKLMFDGVRKPVSAQQLLDCGVLDKPTFNQLTKGDKTVPDVSEDKKVNLKGTGPIAGVVAGRQGKMSLSEAKKQMLLPEDGADLLLEAQAATGHIIDPKTDEKLTVKEACAKGVVDIRDQDKLLAAEAAAIGYKDPRAAKPLSVFEAMKKGLVDKETAVRLLQAQDSTGGILDPILSVFLPKETAIKRNLLDENLSHALNQSPECYLDPETEHNASYEALKKKCKTEPHTGLLLLPVTEKLDPSKLIFDGVRKPVTAQQLLDSGVLDKPTVSQLMKGEKTVPEVSEDKKVFLKGTGSIAGVVAGPSGKMSFSEAKKKMLIPSDSADLLLDAQAATGHIIDPTSNQKLTVDEACARGVVDKKDQDKLLAAERAAVGYRDPNTAKPLSVFEAMKKGMIDRKTAVRLLQAQELAGGILDPNLSVFLPKDTAIKRNLLDDDLCRELNKDPQSYLDPDTERDTSYGVLKKRCKTESHTGLMLLPITERKDPSKLMFDGVRKPVSAQQLLDCGVLDKPTFNQLTKGEKTVPEVSEDKKVNLKGTGPIAGVVAGRQGKMSLSEAKKQMLLPEDGADLLLEAQAATGHIIDPKTDEKLTVKEACAKGVVDIRDQDKLLAAEAAAIGYKDSRAAKPLSVFEAMKKGLVDKETAVRLLQAQDSTGGILDPVLSVFLPKDTAIKRNLLDENLSRALNQSPECFLDPETEHNASYEALKKKCKTEPHTGLLLLPVTEKLDPSKLIFEGVRKPVTAQQLLDSGVLDKPTVSQLMKGEKTVPEVSEDKKVFLKGTGSIAGVVAGPSGKMSFSEAKKKMLIPSDSADLLLDAQAATGHIIDPTSNQKLTVDEACARGVVDKKDQDKLLAAERAAVGYRDPNTAKPLSVFEAMKKGMIDRKTALRLLQAQELAGGILDPNLSVFLPKDTAIKRNLLDDDLCRELNKDPQSYLDPDTERDTSYGALKKRCKTESHTGLMLLPIAERKDPSKLMFDGVRKPVSAQQLLDCGVLDKPTVSQLMKGEKTVPEVSEDKKVNLKGTGPIAGVVAGRQGKMSLSEAKKQMLLPEDGADLLLEAQAATGHIIDPKTDEKLTVKEACAKGVVDIRDQDKLLAAEAAAIGYKDPRAAKPLSVFEAMKKGLVDKETAVRLLQAQDSSGGILDPILSVFLPKDTAIKRNLLDENLSRALNQSPECYLDPEMEHNASYEALKKKCKTEPHTGLLLLPITEKLDPSKLIFDGVRKPVTAQQLLDCGVLDKPTVSQLMKGEKTVPEVSEDKKVNLKGTGPIAGVVAGPSGKMSLSEAKKQNLLPEDGAILLLEAQAATGHITDPKTGQKLTVEEACAKGVVDRRDRDRLLAAEAAAIGYKDPRAAKPLSVFEAMKKGLVDKETAVRLLQAQDSSGGILDPNVSVFLPKDTAIKRNLLDENLSRALNQSPACYLDPETKCNVSYEALKKKCKKEPHTDLLLLPVTEQQDPSKLIFDGVRKPVTAQQLLDCGVLDKPTVSQLMKGEKTVPEVSEDKKVNLKGTGPIAGVAAGPSGKMSLSEAKKQNLLPEDGANLLLEAQAATGHITDPKTGQKLTVEEACAKGVVDRRDRDRLLAAEAAAIGYKDPRAAKPLSVFEAMKKGLVDKETAVRLLQAQDSSGGILDPNVSVFLPKDTAIKRNLLDENLSRALNQSPACYLDPETKCNVSYEALKKKCKKEPHTDLLLLPVTEQQDPSKLIFDGVRKPVTAQQLLDCGVLDKPTVSQLMKGEKTVPEISEDKKVNLKGTGPIAGVVAGPSGKMSLSEAKKQNLLPEDGAILLLEAQAATGHITDPKTGQKLTVEEACAKGVVDRRDRDRLLAAEAAAIGYKDPRAAKPLSVFEAMKKGLVDKETAVRLLQAQDSSGGILDPNVSVFLPKDTAIKRNLLDENLSRALNQSPACYLDPETKCNVSYEALKKKCKKEPHTDLLLLPVTEQQDPSKLIFDGVRKPVTAQQLLDCGVLDKPTVSQLMKGEKTVPEVSEDKKAYLKGTGSIAGVAAGPSGKMSLSEAKKQNLLPEDGANLLLEAQAATGHITDPKTGQKLTVEEACAKGVVDRRDRDRLLAAEAAAIGYKDPRAAKPLSVFEAMKKGLVDKETAVRLLQAQDSSGGILDPNVSVFLPKDTAIKRNLLDENLSRALNQSPECYLDPETKCNVSYEALKKKCKKEPHTDLLLLPVTEQLDPSKLIFDGVRKPVTAQQLLDCGVLDKPTVSQLMKGEKTVPEVSEDKKAYLKGTGSIAGVAAGPSGKMSLSEAKKQNLLPEDGANLLLEAQAATGHITDPKTGQKLTVEEACAKGVVDRRDRDRLLAAEAAAIGYKDPRAAKPLSVFEAMKKGLVDKETAVRLLQAQDSSGGILDPNVSVFLPKDTAIKRNLLDENLSRALNQSPACYLDPETKCNVSYEALKKKCKKEPHTDLLLLPVTEQQDPSKLIFDGVRKPVTAQQLLDCGVLDKPTVSQLMKGEKTVPEVSEEKKAYLKGTGSIAGVAAGRSGKMSLSEAKKKMLMPPDSADMLLEAQAATGHIIDPTSNQKLTVDEACARGVVDKKDRDKLLAAERAAVGYRDPNTAKPLSVFEAMKKGMIDKNTAVRLLQAQELAGGILDPNLSVFLPKNTAIKRNLLDENLCHELNKAPQCYLDPDTEQDTSYGDLKKRCKTESHSGLILLPITERKDPSKLMFDGIRKPVSAQQLFECGVLDKPTFNQLTKGEKTVPIVSVEKKAFLKGTGPIAGVVAGRQGKMSLSEAKKQNLLPADSADLLLEAQAATGYITDPKTNQKLTVEEACAKGVVDRKDRDRLLAAEAAAVGYKDPRAAKPLSVFEAMKKGLVDKETAVRLLQAQLSSGGILDPNVSVFLPKETAIKQNLLDENLSRTLNQSPVCYLDPETNCNVSYEALKKKCKTEPHTDLLLLPVTEQQDLSKLVFHGVRKPITAQQLLDCGVLDKATVSQLMKGEKTVPGVSEEKRAFLKGTGSIAGVVAGPLGKMSFSEAKKKMLMPSDSADLLLEAQAATGHIIDPTSNQKLTVEEACVRGMVDKKDRDKLLAAERAAVGYRDPTTAKPLSVFEAMKKGMIDRNTAVRLLHAQELAGGILDPNLSVFLPKDTAIKRNLLDEDLYHELNKAPQCYLDPDTERGISYGALKKRCKTESHTGLMLLSITERKDPSKLMFDGVRKPVSAQQLFECGILDKPTFSQLVKGEKTIPEVSLDKKVFLKGTGSIAGVAAGPLQKMSFTEAKKQKIMTPASADMLLDAQAATGHIIDPRTNQKLTVKEACARGVLNKEDESKLFAAEAAAIGYRDPHSAKLLSAGQAMKKGLIDKDTALRVLQAQECVGGILDPSIGVFLPKDIAKERDLIDENLSHALSQSPKCYMDPDTQQTTTYVSLKKKCKVDPSTGLLLLPEPKKPITVKGIRDQVSVTDLMDANLLKQSDVDQLREGRLTKQDIEDHLSSYLGGSTCIAGVYDEASDKVLPIYQAMKEELLTRGTTVQLLEAQAASGFIVDPVNNLYLTVSDAYSRGLFGPEFKDKLLAAEMAVTGYKLPGADSILSLFQAIERGLVERGKGLHLLQAQIASGGIIDPKCGHRIDANIAQRRGYFDDKMNNILANEKGFFDPNTEENLTYLELKKRCKTDKKTGLVLLPINEKTKQRSAQKNTRGKRRVVIVDPETEEELTVREAFNKGYIDYLTYIELSKQECEWEEVITTDPNGSSKCVIIDRTNGREYNINELLEKQVISQTDLQRYRSQILTLTQFADFITSKTEHGSPSLSSSSSFSSSTTSRPSAASGTSSVTSILTSGLSAASGTSSVTSTLTSGPSTLGKSSVTSSTLRTPETSVSSSLKSSSSVMSRPLSPTLAKMTTTKTTTITERGSTISRAFRDSPDSYKHISSISVNLETPTEIVGEQEPVGAIFDTDNVEKISVTEALNRDLVDIITAQRLLEAQACTGGIVNPANGQRLSIQEASRMGLIDDDMATKLKPAQKAFIGFEDVKTRKKMSAAQALKERWLPYDAGQRFMEFQVATGGLYDPEMGCRRTIEDALKMGWLDGRTAQKLQDMKNHAKILTCPKSKLNISYKDALDNCLVEESTGVKILQASSMSSRGISSPYNVASAPGSTTGSRSGSRRSSRRASLDLGSPTSSSISRYSPMSVTSFPFHK